ncbi:MAG: hypothetical protein AAF358_26555 [Pseudomonadota bacterium]
MSDVSLTPAALQPGLLRRLLASARCDLLLAWRNGFFVAAAFVTIVHLALLIWMGTVLKDWIISLVLLEIFIFNGFYFAAALVLLQKTEGTLAAQFLTPLRPAEWVAARGLVLSVLAIGEALLVTMPVWRVHLLMLLLSAVLLTCLLCQLGLIMVQRYRGLSDFLMPSSLAFLFLLVPAIELVGVWSSPWLWLHPLTPGLTLLKSAVLPAAGQVNEVPSNLTLLVALLLATLWLVPGQILASRATRNMARGP